MTEDEYQKLSYSLHPIHLRILDIVSPYTTDYIWQHEPFTLSLSFFNPNPNNCPCSPEYLPHFHGKTRYGDNLEDEWFVVFLLFEISRKIPDLSIKVWDSDGEVLLFEAASFLPRWLNPETSKNRVFIRDGKLHIVHKDNMSLNSKLLEMLGFLATFEVDIGAPKSVQLALEKRISGYPQRAQ
ncbi:SGT1 [Macleaya cordata]|uniref:SGT1 n=1 Tax=Macleaya cordata TaxID=56857 RepID=A0A200PUH4_MACCD|nr:SGT1 [Macleaya cordata]